jgi:hypothetical protein
MLKNVSASAIVVVLLGASFAMAQTNASKASAVGTWKLDLEQSVLGADNPPKSVTVYILKDTLEAFAFRVEIIDEEGTAHSFSWSGPADGTLQPLKGADGEVIGQESLKMDGDALLRHGEAPSNGSSFDGRATMSADGNTMTDVVTIKSKDGQVSATKSVYHRTTGADPSRK